MRVRTVVGVLALLVFTGCGSSSSSGSSGSAKTDASLKASIAAGGFTSSDCAKAVSSMAAVAGGLPQAMLGQSAALKTSVDQFEALAKAAPSEIKADMTVLVHAYATFAQVLVDAQIDTSGGKTPSADALQKLADASKSLDTDQVKAASARVQTWFTTKCGK